MTKKLNRVVDGSKERGEHEALIRLPAMSVRSDNMRLAGK
jgi:hypothetical protein